MKAYQVAHDATDDVIAKVEKIIPQAVSYTHLIAGEAAVSHAFLSYGLFPYDARVAIIGNGNTARGAYKTLVSLGAKVDSYNRRTEQELSLIHICPHGGTT